MVENRSIRVLAFVGDLGGCYTYRLQNPFNQLRAFNVQVTALPELPNNPWGDDFSTLCNFIAQYDIVLVQRCYKYNVVKVIRDACDIVGRKLIFETDDDYFNLPPSNPCYPEMASAGAMTGYAQVLMCADQVWVSTKELRDTLYAFNKDIRVFPNNVESIMCGEFGMPCRGHSREAPDENGKIKIDSQHGLVSVPSWWQREGEKERHRTVRIGYTGTPSHHEDFMTIKHKFERLAEKYAAKIWVLFIGDRWFADKFNASRGRVIHIPVSQYSLYTYHLRNIDIGLAPLSPNVFNMSKSPIKAIEYGMWGVPAVLPNMVTYNRDFTHGKNCLMYYNAQEFSDCLEELINNPGLRTELGVAARDYVRDNRLERLHAHERYEAIVDLLKQTKPNRMFRPYEKSETAGLICAPQA